MADEEELTTKRKRAPPRKIKNYDKKPAIWEPPPVPPDRQLPRPDSRTAAEWAKFYHARLELERLFHVTPEYQQMAAESGEFILHDTATGATFAYQSATPDKEWYYPMSLRENTQNDKDDVEEDSE